MISPEIIFISFFVFVPRHHPFVTPGGIVIFTWWPRAAKEAHTTDMISSPMAVYVEQTNTEDDGNQMPNFEITSLCCSRVPQRAPHSSSLSSWQSGFFLPSILVMLCLRVAVRLQLMSNESAPQSHLSSPLSFPPFFINVSYSKAISSMKVRYEARYTTLSNKYCSEVFTLKVSNLPPIL